MRFFYLHLLGTEIRSSFLKENEFLLKHLRLTERMTVPNKNLLFSKNVE